MMSIRRLYDEHKEVIFQCARMGGGYSPLLVYRDPIGSNKWETVAPGPGHAQ